MGNEDVTAARSSDRSAQKDDSVLADVAAESVLLPPSAVASPVELVENAGKTPPVERLRARFVWIILVLVFGSSMAAVVPIGYSLTVKVNDLAPGNVTVLGVVIGAGAFASIICTPLVGVLSDRTRSRLGRRRPWAIGGALVGMVGLYALATAPNLAVLTIAWVVTLVAWQAANNMAIAVQGDRLPEEQRAKVAGFSGFANMTAPVIGILLVSPFASQLTLLFLIPGFVGLFAVVLFGLFVKDVVVAEPERSSLKGVVSNMVFNPRRAPDFGWNFLGRFAFFFGLAFTSTYGTFFVASRLNLELTEVASVVGLIGIGGVVAGGAGAIGVGLLSDKLRRRKIFIVVAALIMLAAALIQAFSYSLPGLVVGGILTTFAIGAFSAVDQAIVLDVLPDRTQAGRYIGIMQVAQQVPGAIAPLVAPLILAIGGAADPNYTLLYISAGVLAVLGALIVLFRVRGVR